MHASWAWLLRHVYRIPALTALVCAGQAYAGDITAVPAMPPLYFEANRGQADADVEYLSRGRGHTLRLDPAGASVAVWESARPKGDRVHVPNIRVVRIEPLGAASEVSGRRQALRGEESLPGRSHYFIGSAKEQWLTNVGHVRKVRYPQVYPGIDLVFHGSAGQLEFDFVLQPGAHSAQIRMRVTGVQRMRLDDAGQLVLQLGGREMIMRAPYAYQDVGGTRQKVASAYRILDDVTIGFQVAAYDVTRPLVIDPILDFSSYAGGSAADIAQGVAFDAAGNLYVVGETYSTDFPTRNPYQATSPVNGSAFVMKLDATTHDVVYATYLGSNVIEARGIAVDDAGSAYVVGDTVSTAFPLMNPYQSSLRGLADIFVSKLTPSGNALAYSTYLGGSSVDRGRALSIDALGDIYITGVTGSTDFPLVNAFQTRLRGSTDAYVAKLSPSRGTLDYSTYLGGGGLDYGTSIAVDATGQSFIGGYTDATNFPTLNPLQATKAGATDIFAARFTAQGGLAYATYLGGSGADYAHALAVDAAGSIYLAGQTDSQNFPLNGPFQAAASGGTDVVVAKLNSAGSALLYSTYLGGTRDDVAYALRLDGAGNAYIAGQTNSADFPVVRAPQSSLAGGTDAFVAALSSDGKSLRSSTFLGGTANDYARTLDVDMHGDVAVAGSTESDDLPRLDANQAQRGGGQDGFVALLLADSDNDGLADRREAVFATDPANPDSDGDGLLDGAEVDQYATDPTRADTDDDGLSDGQEVQVYGSDPRRSDKGDIAPRSAPDGLLNIADMLVLMRYATGLQTPDARASALGDIDKNGVLELRDVLALRRMLDVR